MGKVRQSGSLANLQLALTGLAIFATLSGCRDVQFLAPSTGCQTDVVEIAIWDGYLQSVCNCGTNGAFYGPGSPLTCSFSAGSRLFVYYHGPHLRHQFEWVGTNTLPSGPLFDPESDPPIRAHALTVDAAGTYSFRDAMNAQLTGTFTVTP